MTECLICQRCGHQRHAQRDHHTCRPCSDRLMSALSEVSRRWGLLTPIKPQRGSERVSGPGFGSRSPANDTAISLADPRSAWDGQQYGVQASLVGWVTAVYEDRYLPESESLDAWQWRPANSVPAMCEWLARELDWITRQPWVDDFADELHAVVASLRVQTGDPPAAPIARCIELRPDGTYCGVALYEPEPVPDEVEITCPRCRRTYAGRDLVVLRMANEEAS